TALSATELFGIPCWSTLGTERFGLVSIPSQVEELHLFLDNDDGGRRAELLAAKNFSHLPIQVHFPERDGADYSDILRDRLFGERSNE
ncbi:MAG TPA: toprim domain-containing protein, partial [Sphingomicrobium sp.]|nr:toprim domain-containing protein [Sphingomicrobium sp.]